MRTDTDFHREKFIEYKCSRCRKQYIATEWSMGSRTCPPCSNKEDNQLVNPEDLLIAMDQLLTKGN